MLTMSEKNSASVPAEPRTLDVLKEPFPMESWEPLIKKMCRRVAETRARSRAEAQRACPWAKTITKIAPMWWRCEE
jgi:hypothetical protein